MFRCFSELFITLYFCIFHENVFSYTYLCVSVCSSGQEQLHTPLGLAEASATSGNFTTSLNPASPSASIQSADTELALEVQEQIFHTELLAAALLFLFGAGLAANGLVLLLFHRKPSLRSFSNRFVVHLASIHLLQALLVTPYAVGTAFASRWIFGHVWCQISGVASLALNMAAVLSLLLIAVDRNCAVNSPLHYSMTITKRRTSWLILSVWFLSFLSALPPLLGVSHIEYRPTWGLCSVLWAPGDVCVIIYSIYLCTVGFALPLFKMIWIYCSMFRAAQRSSARARQHSLNSTSVDSSESAPPQPAVSGSPSSGAPAPENAGVSAVGRRRMAGHMNVNRRRSSCSQSFVLGEEWKAARTGLIILISFFVCWFPFFAAALAEPWLPPGFMPGFVPVAATLLTLSASVLDPYIYVFRNRAVRKQLRKLFWCCKSSKNNRLQQRVPYTSEFVGCSMTASFRERNHIWRNASSSMQIVHTPKVLNDIAECPSSLHSPSPPSQQLNPQGPTVDVQTSNVCGQSTLYLRTITNPCASVKGDMCIEEELISVRSSEGLLFLKMRRANRESYTHSDSTLNWGSSCDSSATIEETSQRAAGELVRVHTVSASSRSSAANSKPLLRRSRTVEEQDLTIVVGGTPQLPFLARAKARRMYSEESSEATYTSADSQDLGSACIIVQSRLIRPRLVRQSQARTDPDSSVDEDEEMCYVIKKTSL